MAVDAVVNKGQLVESVAQTSTQKSSTTPNGYDKDAFLQLLVAQMKYQDPMEPTSNTEYISQYATFTQVEELQNMSATMSLSRASAYVGQTVQVSTTDSKGETKTAEGVVDFVTYENGKAYVSVNDELYSADAVTSVIDSEYKTAVEMANSLAEEINKLPHMANLTVADAQIVKSLVEAFNSMNAYQHSFLDKSYGEKLTEYAKRMEVLLEESGETADINSDKEKEVAEDSSAKANPGDKPEEGSK